MGFAHRSPLSFMEYIYTHIWITLGLMVFLTFYIRGWFFIRTESRSWGGTRTRYNFIVSFFFSAMIIPGIIGYLSDIRETCTWLNIWLSQETKL